MEKSMKKKIVIAAVLVAYLGLSAAVVSGVFEKKEKPPVVVEKSKEVDPIDAALAERSFELVENMFEYAAPGQSGLHIETEDLLLLEEDKQSLLSRYELPPLVRMNEADAAGENVKPAGASKNRGAWGGYAFLLHTGVLLEENL